MQERLQRALARAGISSRRKAEEMIANGRVRVNGRIVREQGVKVDLHVDKVEVDGRRIVVEKPVYYLFHKPSEMVTTLSDPQGRRSIKDVTRTIPERVFPVGRLDYHTRGALLLTNDGELAEALLRPKSGVPKVYAVKVAGKPSAEVLDQLRKGVQLDRYSRTQPAQLFILKQQGKFTWLQITLREGKNRQIHRMMDAVGHRVSKLTRLSFAGLSVEDLDPGELRQLGKRELIQLKKNAFAETPDRPARKS